MWRTKFHQNSLPLLRWINNYSYVSKSHLTTQSKLVTHNNVYILVTGRSAILLLHLLGFFPSLQCHICFSSWPTNVDKRKIIRHVPFILILCCQDSWGLTNGACASYNLCNNILLDGRSQAFPSYICVYSLDHAFQCASFSRNRPCTWGHSDWCQTSHNLSLSDHAGVSFSWGLLHSKNSILYILVEVHLFQSLLL